MWINGAVEVLLCLLGITACLWGWGFIAARTIWRGRISPLGPADTVPFGIAAMYIYGVAAAFLFPLNGAVDWIAILAGWTGAGVWAYRSRRDLPDRRIIGLLLFLAVLLAFGLVVTPINFDAGLYQLQVMKYVESEPVPLGIANIQDRLGFNSATIIIGSLLEGSLFGKDGSFLVTAAIFFFFVASCLNRCAKSWSGEAGPFTGLFAGIVLCLWFGNLNGLLFEWYSHGPNGDIPGAVFCAWAFVAFFGLIEDSPEAESVQPGFLLLACCCILAVAVKLSQAPIAALLPIAWRMALPQSTRAALKSSRGPLLPLVAVCAAWLCFGLMTSGCLAFPLAGSCLTFLPWAADPAEAQAQHDAIRAWARTPGARPSEVLNGWNWIAGWTEKMLPYRPIFYSLVSSSFLALLLGGGLRFLRGTNSARTGPEETLSSPAGAPLSLTQPWLAALAVSAAGVGFWFVQAPDPRFGIGFIHCFAAVLSAGIALIGAETPVSASFRNRAGRILAGILALAVSSEAIALSSEREASPMLAWRTPPTPKMHEIRTQSGLAIRAPINGTQCWDEAAICVAYDRTRLSTFRILGRTAFTVRAATAGTAAAPPVQAPPPSPANAAVFDADVWGAEAASFDNKVYAVRWLRRVTPFTVETDSAREAIMKINLGSHDGPRPAELIVNGKSAGTARLVEKNFFDKGPQEISFPVQLTAGRNTFELRSVRDCTEISPGRRVCFLLAGDIELEGKP